MKFRTPRSLLETVREIAKIRQDGKLVAWSLMVILVPFYFLDSGLPQASDYLSIGLLFVLLRSWNGRLAAPFSAALKLLIAFVAYVIIVNLGWSFATFTFSLNSKVGFLVAPSFYIFNGLMFFTFLLMFQRYGEYLLWLTARLVLASVFIQLVLAFVLRSALGRPTVMFNNPNQLGYYALLSACIILLGQYRFRLSTLLATLGVAASAYLALVSSSRAALGSIAGLGIVLLISRLRTIVVASLLFGVLIFTNNPFSAAIERAQHRIETDETHGFIEERGYDRIIDYPYYCVMGSGEGGYNRFRETSLIGAHELHSSIGTLFFSYGIVGVVLFGLFLRTTLAGSSLRTWIIMGAALAYGMTHQGLRFRMLWLLLGMVIALREIMASERAARLRKALSRKSG